MKKILFVIYTSALSLSFTGCASITGSNMQSVEVQAREKSGLEVIGASCELTNDEGKWLVMAPGNVTIHRSNKNLQVSCRKKGLEPGQAAAISDIRGAFWFNLTNVLAYTIDHIRGSAYVYPADLDIPMGGVATIRISKNQSDPTTAPPAKDSSPKDKNMLLILASFKGQIENARFLIEQGANVNGVNRFGETPLMMAALNGHAETARMLIEKGANVSIESKYGDTALNLASSSNNLVLTKLLNLKIQQANFAPPEKIIAPLVIMGNGGRYMSPFTISGNVAIWAQKRISESDGGSDIAASIGGHAGEYVANKALEFVPFGLGGMIGRNVGASAARAATSTNIELELPGMDAVKAGSDISFNSVDELAVYMYVKNSTHSEYERVLELTKRIYPDLQQAYIASIEKASRPSKKIALERQSPKSMNKKDASEKLETLKILKEKGLISEADFEAKKNNILESI